MLKVTFMPMQGGGIVQGNLGSYETQGHAVKAATTGRKKTTVESGERDDSAQLLSTST